MNWNDRVLTQSEVLLVFAALSLLYLYPIIHADFAYYDDNWRALLQAQGTWINEGRALLELLHRALTFSAGTVNIFPLPLLISALALALAMRRLTFWLFMQPRFSSCLVVLPILCNPYYLGNLNYQYDGPGMNLAIVAVIYAITLRIEPVLWRGLAAAVLIAVMLSLYQLTVNLFIGLCIIECVVGVRNQLRANELLVLIAQRVAQLLAGGVLYLLSAYQWVNHDRGEWVALSATLGETVVGQWVYALRQIALLMTPGSSLLIVPMLLLAAFGFFQILSRIPRMQGTRSARLSIAVLYVLSVPALIAGIPGAMLFFASPPIEARNFIAFSAVLIFLFLLNHHVLGQRWPRLRLLLVMPALFMFSLCYAYGQVLTAKKEMAFAISGLIARDIVSQERLRDVKTFYYVGSGTDENWLPRAYPATQAMPVLGFVLGKYDSVRYPYFLPRLGINNVLEGDRTVFEQRIGEHPSPVVDNLFYSIYVTADIGFIVSKVINVSQNYDDNRPSAR